VVGVNGDLIEQYLSRLRADLRTPADRTAQILAEAEDHLRESAAAGIAIGMTEREAQEAAISAFGSVRAVVRAHRRMAAAAAEVAMEAWKLAALYLLAVPVADLALTIFFYQIVHLHTVTPVPATHSLVVTNSPPDVVGLVAGLCSSAIAGLALLLGYRRVRRSRCRRGRSARAPFGGFFPLVAAIFMLFAGPTAAVLIAPHMTVAWGFKMLAAAAVLASVLVALSYAAAMAMTLARQRRDGGTTDREARYAG
jgi:HAAS